MAGRNAMPQASLCAGMAPARTSTKEFFSSRRSDRAKLACGEYWTRSPRSSGPPAPTGRSTISRLSGPVFGKAIEHGSWAWGGAAASIRTICREPKRTGANASPPGKALRPSYAFGNLRASIAGHWCAQFRKAMSKARFSAGMVPARMFTTG